MLTYNILEVNMTDKSNKLSRVIDLDIDIGADAVDYKCVPHQLQSVNTDRLSLTSAQ